MILLPCSSHALNGRARRCISPALSSLPDRLHRRTYKTHAGEEPRLSSSRLSVGGGGALGFRCPESWYNNRQPRQQIRLQYVVCHGGSSVAVPATQTGLLPLEPTVEVVPVGLLASAQARQQSGRSQERHLKDAGICRDPATTAGSDYAGRWGRHEFHPTYYDAVLGEEGSPINFAGTLVQIMWMSRRRATERCRMALQ